MVPAVASGGGWGVTDLHLLPADALPDLLTGCNITIEAYVGPDCGWIPCPMVDGHAGWALHAGLPKRLDLTRPEALDHVARVLARGVRCDLCGGTAASAYAVSLGARSSPCPRCTGSGYLRPPAPVWHLLDAERTGALSRLHIAEAVGWSVRAGRALPAVYGPWTRWGSAGLLEGLVQYDRRPVAGTGPVVSYFDGRPRSGGRAEWMLTRAEADVVALRHGGRIDGETLTLPEIT